MADMPIPVAAAVRMSLDIAVCFLLVRVMIVPIRVKVNPPIIYSDPYSVNNTLYYLIHFFFFFQYVMLVIVYLCVVGCLCARV